MPKGSGQVAYEGYRRFSEGKSLASGEPIPEWDGLALEIQRAWEAAAMSVLNHFYFVSSFEDHEENPFEETL